MGNKKTEVMIDQELKEQAEAIARHSGRKRIRLSDLLLARAK